MVALVDRNLFIWVNNRDQDPDHEPQQSDDVPQQTTGMEGNVGQNEESCNLSPPNGKKKIFF